MKCRVRCDAEGGERGMTLHKSQQSTGTRANFYSDRYSLVNLAHPSTARQAPSNQRSALLEIKIEVDHYSLVGI